MNERELLFWQGKRYEGFLIIQNHDLHAGFGALLLYALNGIRKAEAMNVIPVIDFNCSNSRYFYDAGKGEAVWDYYFEPVSPYNYPQIRAWQEAGIVSEQVVHFISSAEAAYTHQHDPERLATFWAWQVPKDKKSWMSAKRSLGRQYIQNYVCPKRHILQKVGDFTRNNFKAKLVIGIHIRGTDFTYAQPIPVETYARELENLLGKNEQKDYQIFVATEQQQYLDFFIGRYGRKVVYLNVTRSDSHIAPFRFENVSGYQKGEEVLLDTLLLSRCQHIIKGPAATGELALWFNKNDSITDFALQSQFNETHYSQLESAYALLNIGGKGALRLQYHRLREHLVRRLIVSRIGQILYNNCALARKFLKH